jgi:protein-S-isoprenylcysteine O-methyltransferase Ste14
VKRALVILLYSIVFWILLPAALFYPAILLDRRGFRLRPSRLRRLAGVVLSATSAVLLYVSVRDFRRGARKLPITAIPPWDRLVTSGVYSIWRHPLYLFFTSLLAGCALIVGSGGFLFVILPVFASLELLHARIEERWLARKHGKAYDQYKKTSSLIVPKLR